MATPIEMLFLRTRRLSLGRLMPRYCIVMDGRKVARMREGTSRVQRVPAGARSSSPGDCYLERRREITSATSFSVWRMAKQSTYFSCQCSL